MEWGALDPSPVILSHLTWNRPLKVPIGGTSRLPHGMGRNTRETGSQSTQDGSGSRSPCKYFWNTHSVWALC